MQHARLKFDGGDIELSRDVTTIGRTPDNDVSFAGDSNVSRAHAEIERRDGEFYLIDPGSSNGTTVNGTPVAGEVRLSFGDKLSFGGSSNAEFVSGEASPGSDTSLSDAPGVSELQSEASSLGSEAESAADNALREAIEGGIENAISGGAATEGASASAVAASSGSSPTVLIAGAVCGLAVVAVIAAGAVYYARSSSSCDATARIVRPEPGDTITKPTDIELKVTGGDCVQRAVITVDGREVAKADAPAFTATIDPKDMPEMADGDVHNLAVVLIDESGGRIEPDGGVMLAFETKVASRSPTPVVAPTNTQPGKPPVDTAVTLIQVQQMSQELLKKFSGGFTYNVSNKQLMQEIQKRTGEYAVEGYSARAAAYRDAINVAFVREQNIDAPLGFLLAMSRSRFDPAKKGDLEGLWQMTNAFVTENKYNGACGTETLSDPTQNCAAKAAALYTKAIVFGVFDGDPIYSAAAFGKTPADAATWKTTLPANRSDVWKSIKTALEREQIVRFFAAGIVAENPQRFGLKKDQPLSELYKVTM